MKPVELSDKDIDRIVCGLMMYRNSVYRAKEELHQADRATSDIQRMLQDEANSVIRLVEKLEI